MKLSIHRCQRVARNRSPFSKRMTHSSLNNVARIRGEMQKHIRIFASPMQSARRGFPLRESITIEMTALAPAVFAAQVGGEGRATGAAQRLPHSRIIAVVRGKHATRQCREQWRPSPRPPPARVTRSLCSKVKYVNARGREAHGNENGGAAEKGTGAEAPDNYHDTHVRRVIR